MKIKYLFYTILTCLVLGYTAFCWNEPTETMPSNYVAPINVGVVSQTKIGEISASLFRDTEDPDYYINPGASSKLGTLIVDGQIESTSGGVKFPDGTVQTTALDNIEAYTSFMGINFHSQVDCEEVGGTVWNTPDGIPICRISASNLEESCGPCACDAYMTCCSSSEVSCPSGWQRYKLWSTTEKVSYYRTTGDGCSARSYTLSHAWANTATDCEEDAYNNNQCARIVEIGCY